jgi:hypothetical protein
MVTEELISKGIRDPRSYSFEFKNKHLSSYTLYQYTEEFYRTGSVDNVLMNSASRYQHHFLQELKKDQDKIIFDLQKAKYILKKRAEKLEQRKEAVEGESLSESSLSS